MFKKPSPGLRSQRFTPVFAPKSFIVSALTCRSVAQSELSFVCGARCPPGVLSRPEWVCIWAWVFGVTGRDPSEPSSESQNSFVCSLKARHTSLCPHLSFTLGAPASVLETSDWGSYILFGLRHAALWKMPVFCSLKPHSLWSEPLSLQGPENTESTQESVSLWCVGTGRWLHFQLCSGLVDWCESVT